MQSELSGNVVDLCPVGALTSKPTAFTYRSWELRSTDSIDVSDALGSNIRVDARGSEVMRIMPRLNDEVNQEWISDKTRYQFDGLRYQRLATPMVKVNGKLESCDWPTALQVASKALGGVAGNEIRAVAGKLADVESMVLLKDLMNRLGCEDVRHESLGGVQADLRSSYVFNSGLAGMDDADAILLVGTNPRIEGPVLNARIRAQAMYGGKVGVVGQASDLTYPYQHLGESLAAGLNAAAAQKFFQGAENPVIVVGSTVFQDPSAMAAVHDFVSKQGPAAPTLNVLHDCASAVGALDSGFIPGKSVRDSGASARKVVYLLNADDYENALVDDAAFVIYQGHHGDKGASRADVVLPGAAYTEKYATYVNTEGRSQTTKNAVAPVAEARVDWEIIRALSEVCGKTLPVDSLEDVRERMAEVAPSLVHRNKISGAGERIAVDGAWWRMFAEKKGGEVKVGTAIEQFYMTDAVSRASKIMARCVKYKQ
jgi:NADH dehydrogenase (ubiquinone) Fe-S protein 1